MKFLIVRKSFFLVFLNTNYLNNSFYSLNNFSLEYNKVTFKKKSLNFSFFEKFIKVGLKRGLNLKFIKQLSIGFSNFFLIFLFNSLNFFKKYQNIYNVFYFFSKTSNFFFNINYIFKLLIDSHQPMFGLKCEAVPKKYIKKLKKKFTFRLNYISWNKRNNVIIRWFYLMIGKYPKLKLFNKFFYLLIEVFLKGNKSPLLIKKNNIYKKILVSKLY